MASFEESGFSLREFLGELFRDFFDDDSTQSTRLRLNKPSEDHRVQASQWGRSTKTDI